MIVKFERPPLFDEIDAAFHIAGVPVIFAWGNTIYNPEKVGIPPELFAHEAVHGERQGTDVEAWWYRYIEDPEFRLAEEIPAHVAEFNTLCEKCRDRWPNERNMRRAIASHVARKLSAPLYGSLISYRDARKIVKVH